MSYKSYKQNTKCVTNERRSDNKTKVTGLKLQADRVRQKVKALNDM